VTMPENGETDGAGWEDTYPMEPDHEACYRALSTRDARFDGRFFIAVRTTRIYCRPICPAGIVTLTLKGQPEALYCARARITSCAGRTSPDPRHQMFRP